MKNTQIMSLLCLKCANVFPPRSRKVIVPIMTAKGLRDRGALGHFLLTFCAKLQPHWAPCPSLNTPEVLSKHLKPCPHNLEFSSYRYLPWLLFHFLRLSAKTSPSRPHQHEHCFSFRCSTFHHFILTYISAVCYIYLFIV